MGIHSRNKGKAGEIEVRDLFRKALKDFMPDTDVIRRNHQQAEIGGADLVNVPYMSVEVKRVKQITWGKGLMDWWEQCVEQATLDNKVPCLVFRQDHGQWLVMYPAHPVAAVAWTFPYPMIMLWKEFERYIHATLRESKL